MQNISSTILSQYANSPAICTIIDAWNQAIDPSALIDKWYANVWDVQTAVGYGLDVWGRIVGVSRVLNVSGVTYLGWNEANDLTEDSWNNGIWYSGTSATNNVLLSDDAFRTLIYAKALANISDNSITSINKILTTLFSAYGEPYVQDNGNMSMTYVFNFHPTAAQISIIQNSGVLPRPSGVAVNYSIM